MDYPTDEDLYELQYQDELDALNEMEPVDSIENEDFDPFSFGPKPQPVTQKENVNKCQSNITNKISTAEIPEKEISTNGKLPTKRKLLYTLDDDTSECDAFNDLVMDLPAENVISQPEKRKASCVFGDELEIDFAVKKRCTDNKSLTEALRSHSEEACHSRPSTSKESSAFLMDSLPLTRSDGRRIYFNVKDEEDDLSSIPNISDRAGCLLPIPIEKLKSQYFIMEEQLLKEKEAISMESTSSIPDVEEIDEDKENALWVEKYRPMSYTHLLSEEGINRTMLQWLKLWDKIVFGKEKKVKKKAVVDPKKENKFKKTWGELVEDLDEHGRPHHKVAFLCGPPGLGKTTLATIIARHAGYNVVELNASDDRNPEAFRTSLEAATQMKSVLMNQNSDEKPKPNCLILDEIDGAPAASINVLLSFIKSVGIPKGAKRKKGDIPLLTRPLICICNDQYSAALKPLRQLALVLNFPSTAASRLASRLHEVASKEGLVADMSVLTKLCEKTCNDIRSCLSTLQFIHRQKHELKTKDLEGLHIGQKDMQKSLFAVWQDIFYFKHRKSFTNVFNVIQAFGDYEKIYIGMFENYLNMKFKHKTLDVISQGAEWNCFGDIVQQQIAHRQLYFLMPYLPYPAVAFHMLFASNIYPQISYPTVFYEHKAKASQLSSTLTSVIKDMVSSLKTFLNPSILLVDVFPFLTEIIKPNLRPVNTQLYSDREKGELRRVIELMLAFNLNYHQERSIDGTYNYILDPNIEELIKFSDIKNRKVLTYSTKQMIAREVEVEQMRKGDSSADKKAEIIKTSEAPKKVYEPPKTFQKRKEVVVERPVLDFFGRQIVPTANSKSEEKKDARDEEVWFHFKEGYSNAVRRTVYIKNLI